MRRERMDPAAEGGVDRALCRFRAVTLSSCMPLFSFAETRGFSQRRSRRRQDNALRGSRPVGLRVSGRRYRAAGEQWQGGGNAVRGLCESRPRGLSLRLMRRRLRSFPVYRRCDGKDVRYLPVPAVDRRPRSIDLFSCLSRQPDAEPALEPVEPLDAFSTLLESAFSAKGSITAPALKTFARAMEGGGKLPLRLFGSRRRDRGHQRSGR